MVTVSNNAWSCQTQLLAGSQVCCEMQMNEWKEGRNPEKKCEVF